MGEPEVQRKGLGQQDRSSWAPPGGHRGQGAWQPSSSKPLVPCVSISVSQSLLFLSVSISFFTALFCVSPSFFPFSSLALPHLRSPRSLPQLSQAPQRPPKTPPCAPLLLAASSVSCSNGISLALPATPRAVTMTQSGWGVMTNLISFACGPLLPEFWSLGKGPHAWRSMWSPCCAFVQTEPGPRVHLGSPLPQGWLLLTS